eukprot:Seg5055.1 transcript_id=Seg5055.1/GoldUCD/mRNA.D3Y31 product="hypothetical protein" protein_id=Seg5055.1/GoldUCD/D3Y31
MDAEELCRICVKRWLGGDFMKWTADQLNKQQDEMLCIYANIVPSVGNFIRRNTKSTLPKKLGFIFNVGKRRHVVDGREEWEVYLGRMGLQGNHFSIAVVDIENNRITYGDSLGWQVPANLLQIIRPYYVQLFPRQMPQMTVEMCHPTPNASGSHSCSASCASLFLLQRGGTVCGIVAIAALSIACLAPRYFALLTDKALRGAERLPQLFISKPHAYSMYLTRVIMAWMSEEKISIEYVTPTQLLGNNSDDLPWEINEEFPEDEDVLLVDFDIDEKNDVQPANLTKIKSESDMMKKRDTQQAKDTFFI